MSNQILSQVKNLSLDEKRDFLILLDELEEAKSREKVCYRLYGVC